GLTAIRTEVVSTRAARRSASDAPQASSTAAKRRMALPGAVSSARAWGITAIEAREASPSSLAIVTRRPRFSARRGPELLLALALARALEPELDFERKS